MTYLPVFRFPDGSGVGNRDIGSQECIFGEGPSMEQSSARARATSAVPVVVALLVIAVLFVVFRDSDDKDPSPPASPAPAS